MGLFSGTFDPNRPQRSKYFVHVQRAVAQTISDSTVTKVEFDTIIYDPLAMYDTGNDRVIIPLTGTWQFTYNGSFDANIVGIRQFRLHVANVTLISLNSWQTSTVVGEEVYGSTSITRRFTIGDLVSAHVFQTSGGNLDISVGTPRDIFTGVLLHV
jgi:hypothetical protein